MKKNISMKEENRYSSPELSIIEIVLEGAVLAASTEQFFDDDTNTNDFLKGWS